MPYKYRLVSECERRRISFCVSVAPAMRALRNDSVNRATMPFLACGEDKNRVPRILKSSNDNIENLVAML